MSEKAFGIKKIEIKGSGIPTLDSPTDLYLNAVNVSISTDVTIGRNINVSGISTFGSNVIISGNTSINQLSVSGSSVFNSTSTFSQDIIVNDDIDLNIGTDGDLKIWHSTLGGFNNSNIAATGNSLTIQANLLEIDAVGGTNYIRCASPGSVSLYYNGDKKFETLGTGVTITGTTFTNQLSVGVGGSIIHTNEYGVGIGTTNATSKLSVNGGIQLAQNNLTIVGTSGTVGEIKRIGGAPFFYDGSAWREFVLSSGTPVSVPADTEWDNVIFRATFDDDYTDTKFGATPVYVGAGSTIVGAAVTIGTGAYRNDGSIGAGISYAYRSEYDFTGSWTIEFWMYVDTTPVYSNPLSPVSLISMHSSAGIGTSGNWTLAMYGDQFANKYISWFNQNHPSHKTGYPLYNVSGATWSNVIENNWNHFAIVRESTTGSLHFYLNGIEESTTSAGNVIDNNIIQVNGLGLNVGGATTFTVGSLTFNSFASADVIIDDMRISAGVGTAGQRYTSVGIWTAPTFTPPSTALPITGTLSSYIQPPADKYGEISLGVSPIWRGTSGVTVSRPASGNYRVSFASSYTNSNDYYVLSQGMDQGFASYVGIARSTTHVDISINRLDNDATIDSGSLSVQIKNHI